MATSTFPPIIVTAHPQGKFLEGVVAGTPLPGTIMAIVGGTPQQEGRFTWQSVDNVSVGYPCMQVVLREDDMQGGLSTTAYVAGTRCFMYCPIASEEMNVLYGQGSGTSNSLVPGQLLAVDSGVGVLVNWVSTGSPTWIAYDTLTLVVEDTLAWVARL